MSSTVTARPAQQRRTKDYILTESGNRISRQGLKLVDTQHIVLGGKTIIEQDVTIRGDLKRRDTTTQSGVAADAAVRTKSTAGTTESAVLVGRYCLLARGCSLIPPHKLRRSAPASAAARADADRDADADDDGTRQYYPLKLGDYVYIGQGSTVQAASIASFCHVGRGCTVGNMCILKEGCVLEDGTELAPFTVVAPLSRVRGRPGLVVGEMPEVTCDVLRERRREHYATVMAQP